ncbi:MAG: hypothetical protein FH762_20050 [Firmicutes bacterium]|nr:hypothetical protein [Bacillota bacterium]
MNDLNLDLANLYEDYETIGYHGHVIEVINDILKTKKFTQSNGNWCYAGKGVYFFDNDLSVTERWCERARKYKEYGIVKVDIKAYNIIDLDNNVHYNKIEKFARLINERYKSLSNKKELDTKLLFDYIYNYIKYDLVKFTTKIKGKGARIIKTHIFRNSVILCVRNHRCISNVRKVKEVKR